MADQIHFPRPSDEGRMTNFEWMPIRYRNVIADSKKLISALRAPCGVETQGLD